jgi:acetyl esterase/lipase
MGEVTRRTFGLFAGAGAMASLSRPALGASAPGAFDPTPFVNPELRRFVPGLLKAPGAPPTDASVAALRRRPPAGGPADLSGWSEQMIPGPAGAPQVRVYLINARKDGPARPALLHMHGGGFVFGAAASGIRSLLEMARALDCLIVSVDYRLAPETRFPGSLEDNYAGLKWLYANAARLGVDRSRIAVIGESAGGGHAAMLAIAARDRGEIPLAYQALIYPMLDDRTGSTRKTPPYQGALIWTPAENRYGWSALLGVPAGSARVPYGSAPARVENLRGLPPAFIGVGSIDLFVDEDIEYARRLIDVGVPVELNVVPGAFHGFDVIADVEIAKLFRAALIRALSRALKATG